MPKPPEPKSPGLLGIWEHFTLADGLPDLKIECLFADSQGNLWVGTHDRGTACFDGDRFQTFTTRDGLVGDGVFSILEDREGALWFGTLSGLSRYDGKRFETVRPRSGEPCGFMWGSCVDREGKLWFGVKGRPGSPAAVCRWNGKELERIALSELISPHESSITQITVSPSGEVWCGGADLYRYDGRQFQCLAELSPSADQLLRMQWRSNEELWCVSCGGDLKVYTEGRFNKLRSAISGLTEDSTGALWLTSWKDGLLRHDDTSFQAVYSPGTPLWGNPCPDRVGRLWCGTYGHGLYCYDTTRFEVFTEAQGLPANYVTCLAEDTEGSLWVGTSAGIVASDGKGFQPLDQAGALSGQHIYALQTSAEDRLWIATWGSLYLHMERTLQLAWHPPSDLEASCLELSCLAPDRKGGIWFGYQYPNQGFRYYKDGQVQWFPFAPDYPVQIGGMLLDREGHLWVGSRYPDTYEGVCHYDGERFTPFKPEDGLAGGGIYTLYEDQEGRVWIGASQGVSRYDGKEFTTFTCAEGLPYEIVKAIAQTDDGRMWFGTEGGGVGLFDGQVFQTIQIPGDLDLNAINVIHQDRRGQVWFATRGGLVRYTPQRMPPQVELTGIVADRTYGAKQPLEIPTTAGRLSFCFQGKSRLDRTSRLVYRYRLEGHDSEWRQTRERQVDYPRLAPGDYCFQVQAVDTDLNYSEVAAVQIRITADPHLEALTQALRPGRTNHQFIGQSRALRQVEAELAQVALTDLTVLILGETGTGKGLAAWAIHGQSPRQNGPFIQVNCGAIPRELVESELFGHERGAFTGAVSRKLGKFELAEGGTLFLDEIGDLPLDSQAALLQCLQEKTFQRVGGRETLRGDVRVIAATNRDLHTSMAKGLFRQDLFYRLSAFAVELPPLRQRREDIPLLVEYFVQGFARHLNRPMPSIDPVAMDCLQHYDWPGNVRELEHLMQRAVLLCKDNAIREEDVAVILNQKKFIPQKDSGEPDLFEKLLEKVTQQGNGGQHNLLKTTEEMVVRAALARSQGNRRKAAALLGVDRKKVERSLKKYRTPDNGADPS